MALVGFLQSSSVDIPTWAITPAVLAAIAIVGGLLAGGKWIGNVNSDRKKFDTFMEEIRASVQTILFRLPERPVSGASPLQLTALGQELAGWLDASAWAANVATGSSDDVFSLEPFELDEYAATYVDDLLDDEMKRKVSECAYEFGIERDGVLDTLRVVLRDELLQRGQGRD